MITRIEIENFKGIGERVAIDLKPITLLFGPNSAGKSTVTHALHYAREVLGRRNYDADKTIAGGDFVDLGGFRSFIHMKNTSKCVKFKFHLDLRDVSFRKYFPEVGHLHFDEYALPQISENVASAAVEFWIAFCPHRKKPYVSRYAIDINGVPFAAIESTYDRVYGDDRVEKYLHTNNLEEINHEHPLSDTAFQGLAKEPEVYPLLGSVFSDASIPLAKLDDALPFWGSPLQIEIALPTVEDPQHAHLGPTMRKGLDRWSAVISQLMVGPGEVLSRELDGFRHLGPFRETIGRNYHPPRTKDESRWITGLAAWDLLSTRGPEFVEQASEWLSVGKLDSGYSLELERYKELPLDSLAYSLLSTHPDPDRVLEDMELVWGYLEEQEAKSRLILRDDRLGLPVIPQDLGVGISQLVPIVVVALDPETRVASIEQPELHVHPRLQAGLGDLFAEFAAKGKLFILETHSEHLILRIQRRIREAAEGHPAGESHLTAGDVTIYYLNPRSEYARFERIDLDRRGEFLQPWPDDFFELDFYERFGRAD